MALEFINIEPKTGEALASVPNRVAEHTYLEHRIVQAQAAGQLPQSIRFYVAKLADGVSAADLHHLRETRGIHTIGSNRRSAYFVGDEQTADWIKQELFTNHSDPVAYFSVLMSHALASTVKEKAWVLVIDDGEPIEGGATRKWGRRKVKDRDGNEVDPSLLHQAHRMLGDGYCLVAPDLHRQVGREAVVDQAHRIVDEGRLAIVQTYRLDETATIKEWSPTETAELVASYLETAVAQAFNRSATLDNLAEMVLDDLKSPLQVSKPRLEADPIRGEVATVRWRYTDLSSSVTYTGRAMLERRPQPEGSLHLTIVGGTYKQKATVAKTMDAIATSDLTPFQLRGGVNEWKGGLKGTSRAASICDAIGVDAIVPKSAIKADGKTTPLGVSEVSSLFWARKSDARVGTQRLGTQVLVNLPQGTEADILPKLEQKSLELMETTRDPRTVADLYCQSYECRQAYIDQTQKYEEIAESAAQATSDFKSSSAGGVVQERTDWLYEALKRDTKPMQVVKTFDVAAWRADCFEYQGADPERDALWQRKLQGVEAELAQASLTPEALRTLIAETLQLEEQNPDHRAVLEQVNQYVELSEVGGYGQLLENPKVVDRLNQFLKDQQYDIATGGVSIPSATAQPHAELKPGEICTTALPHGARVAAYRSPVANVGQMRVLTNNRAALQQNDLEALAQVGTVYLNPTDAKEMVIDFDIDSVGLVPEEEYVRARAAKLLDEQALQPGECYISTLPVGQQVTLYHSHDQMLKLTNVNAPLSEGMTARKGSVFLSKDDWATVDERAAVTYGYYDDEGRHGFKILVNEVEALTQPEMCPPAVEKRTKIPRDTNHPDVSKMSAKDQEIAAQFTCLEAAMIHAADNPTGIVANIGMRLQAVKQHLDASDVGSQVAQVKAASERFKQLLKNEGVETPQRHPFIVPEKTIDGYSLRDEIVEIAEIYRAQTKPLKLMAHLQQQEGQDLIDTVNQIQKHFYCVQNVFDNDPPLAYPDPAETGGYDFQAEAEWIAASRKFLNASTLEGKVNQANQIIVPRVLQFLDQLDQLPDGYVEPLKKPFTNYVKAKEVKDIEIDQSQQQAAALAAVPKLRKLLEVTQHRLLDEQLQVAVETDKSARSVDQEILTFAQSIASYQDVDWIKGKKREDVYLTSSSGMMVPMNNNTLDPVGKIVEQTNRYYEVAEPISAMNLEPYQFLVPKPENEEIHQIALGVAQDYNAKIARAKGIEADAKINPGVKLAIESPDLPVRLNVTNLASFDPKGTAPIWQAIRDQTPIYFNIAENIGLVGLEPKHSKAWQTQGSLEQEPTHQYQVVAQIPDAEGALVSYSIGTLEQKSIVELERALENAAKQESANQGCSICQEIIRYSDEPFVAVSSRLTLLPNYDKEIARDLMAQAETELREWVGSIQPEDRSETFRGLYHARDQAEDYTKTASGGQLIAMRLFTDQLIPQIQQYSLTQGQVNGIQYNRANIGSEVEWSGQTVPVRTAICDNPDQEKICGKAVWQVGVDEPIKAAEQTETRYQRNWYIIGTVDEIHCRPPIGVQAMAKIQEQRRYGIAIGEDKPLTLAAEREASLQTAALQGLDLSQPIQVSFKQVLSPKNQREIVIYCHPQGEGNQQDPVRLGKLEKVGAAYISKHHGNLLLPNKNKVRLTEAKVVDLLIQIAQLTILPESVERPQPGQWCKPSATSWQAFTAEQSPIEMAAPVYSREAIMAPRGEDQSSQGGGRVDRLMSQELVEEGTEKAAPGKQGQNQSQNQNQLLTAAEKQADVVSPTPEVPSVAGSGAVNPFKQRYQAIEQQVQPSFALLEQQTGNPIQPHEKDKLIVLKLRSEQSDAREILNVLVQSPVSQALLQKQGKEAASQYIAQVVQECNALIQARQKAQSEAQANTQMKGNGKVNKAQKKSAEMSR